MIALGTVAALAIVGQVVVQYALVEQRASGHVVNQAGRQRMLSQRLTLKALLLEEAASEERLAVINEMRLLNELWLTSHSDLIEAARRLAADDAARDSLLGLLAELERPMLAVSGVVAKLVEGGSLDPVQRRLLLRNQEIFLPLMDAAVRQLEQSATARVTALQRVELGLLFFTLVVLAIEALLVFRPAVDRLARTLAELEQKRRTSAGRLESLRHLAGGIAHHFNNILTSILGNAELIRLDAEPHGRVAGYAEAQVRQCERAAGMISQLVLYGGDRKIDPRPTALGPWLRGVIRDLPSSARGGTVEFEVVEDAVAEIDGALLHQAIEGLMANAAEAMADRSGSVCLELDQEILSAPKSMAGPYDLQLPPGLYARIRVIDQGVGIQRTEIDQIFDPFYTHKSFGRGMGLASILGVAHAHQGAIEVESVPEQGTTVSLYLPISVETPRPEPGRRSERVTPPARRPED